VGRGKSFLPLIECVRSDLKLTKSETMREFNQQEMKQAKAYIRKKEAAQILEWKKLHTCALSDAAMIIDMIIKEYDPLRVYQWGSLLRPENFRSYSDIDIGVDGITDPEVYFDLLGAAQAMSKFPVDIVQMEKIEPEYVEDIKMYGRLVYERK